MQTLRNMFLVVAAAVVFTWVGCAGTKTSHDAGPAPAPPDTVQAPEKGVDEAAAELPPATDTTRTGDAEAVEADAAENGQQSPRATLKKFFRALEAADKDDFVACVRAEGAESDVLEAAIELARAGARLNRRIEEAYGEDGLRAFESAGGRHEGAVVMARTMNVDRWQIQTDGDCAVATPPYGGATMRLVREDATWYVAAMGTAPPGQKGEFFKDLVRSLTWASEQTASRVGAEGESPTSLARLSERLTRAVLVKHMVEFLWGYDPRQADGPAPSDETE